MQGGYSLRFDATSPDGQQLFCVDVPFQLAGTRLAHAGRHRRAGPAAAAPQHLAAGDAGMHVGIAARDGSQPASSLLLRAFEGLGAAAARVLCTMLPMLPGSWGQGVEWGWEGGVSVDSVGAGVQLPHITE
jgi:hypothetical protein